MKINCEIIKDLLPLYHDGVCSNETKSAVEEHLNYCESCKAELHSMDKMLPINNTEQNLNEALDIKDISKKWKKGMFKSLLKGILFTIAVILLLYIFADIKIVSN